MNQNVQSGKSIYYVDRPFSPRVMDILRAQQLDALRPFVPRVGPKPLIEHDPASTLVSSTESAG